MTNLYEEARQELKNMTVEQKVALVYQIGLEDKLFRHNLIDCMADIIIKDFQAE